MHTDLAHLVRVNPNALLATRFLNGRLGPVRFREVLGGLPLYDRLQVVRFVDALALASPRPLTADQVACLDELETPPSPPVTDTGDVDPGQIDPVVDSSQFLP
jgi:hypothetical protein